MVAKITPIKSARRPAEVDVMKLICNCDSQAFTFRVTVIGDQVVAECCICLQDYGPFYLTQAPVIGPVKKDGDED